MVPMGRGSSYFDSSTTLSSPLPETVRRASSAGSESRRKSSAVVNTALSGTAASPASDDCAHTWLLERHFSPSWLLRHMPAPWNKEVRVSALSLAAYENNSPVVQWLFQHGCGLSEINRKAPIRIAVQHGSIEAIKAIYESTEPDVLTVIEDQPKSQPTKRPQSAGFARGIKALRAIAQERERLPQGAAACLQPIVAGDSLVHTALRAGQLGAAKHLMAVLAQRQSICIKFDLMKKGDKMGHLTDVLSYRMRNVDTDDELMHAAAASGNVSAVQWLHEGLIKEAEEKSKALDAAYAKADHEAAERNRIQRAEEREERRARGEEVSDDEDDEGGDQLGVGPRGRWGAAGAWGKAVVKGRRRSSIEPGLLSILEAAKKAASRAETNMILSSNVGGSSSPSKLQHDSASSPPFTNRRSSMLLPSKRTSMVASTGKSQSGASVPNAQEVPVPPDGMSMVKNKQGYTPFLVACKGGVTNSSNTLTLLPVLFSPSFPFLFKSSRWPSCCSQVLFQVWRSCRSASRVQEWQHSHDVGSTWWPHSCHGLAR